MNKFALIPDPRLLLHYLNAKDNRAFCHLYEVYYPALKSLAGRYVRDGHAAADLVQDVFISLLESDYVFQRPEEVKFFLYRALRNRCISHCRKQKVRDRYRLEVRDSGEEHDDFWEKVLEEDVYASLSAAVATLPGQCRKVILCSLDGMKTAEIAALLRISEETVKEHKKNGRRKLSLMLRNPLLVLLLSLI